MIRRASLSSRRCRKYSSLPRRISSRPSIRSPYSSRCRTSRCLSRRNMRSSSLINPRRSSRFTISRCRSRLGSYPQQQAPQQPIPQPQESLIHPLLMRNGDSRPLQKPTTLLPSLDLLTPPPAEVEPIDTFALEQMARLVEARLADFRIKADVVNYSRPGYYPL